MAQHEMDIRQYLIIRKLRIPSTFQEIHNYLSLEFQIRDMDLKLSKRTFERDLKYISKIYGITINNRSDNKYYIEDDYNSAINDRMFEAYDLYNALNITEQNRDYIYLENRHASGIEHSYDLLHAIKKRLEVSFNYLKYSDEQPTQRKVKPLALKEFKYRWYLIARDERDEKDKNKRFALDRISDLKITNLHFDEITGIDIEQMHAHCFGIMVPKDYKVQKVVLSFIPNEGKYIKSLPLHPTQKILIDNEKELRISLNIYITYDFIQEIFSFMDSVKVLEPQSLVNEIKALYRKGVELY
jgi:predicted DNA-binding transcriptional regulator YafY